VPPADAGALAVALGRLLSSTSGGATELAARLGHNGRRRVLERFTWDRCARGVVEQYRHVLTGHVLTGHVLTGHVLTGHAGYWHPPC